jgi:phosphonate degradation associated HDIG domain protein
MTPRSRFGIPRDARQWSARRTITVTDPDAFVTELLALLVERGREHYDGPVSQLEHAVQCALLAAADGAPESLITAALLHDVGHLIDGDHDGGAAQRGDDLRHEATGAAFLRRRFASDVVAPVALHVRAKRYLVSVDPEYAGRLSLASQRSLAVQGGALAPAERAAFEGLPFADASVRLRRWDDAAKIEGMILPPVATYAPVLRRLTTRAAAGC